MLATAGPLYSHLRKRGILIVFWTPDSKSDMDKIMEFYPDFDGVLTDRIVFAKDYLSALS